MYWSDHYPFKSFGQGTYYPGIEPYLTKRKWHHTGSEYRKTVATKISDPKFQDFIVEVMKAKMQSFQTDGIFLDFWGDNHTHYSGYSKNKVIKARI